MYIMLQFIFGKKTIPAANVEVVKSIEISYRYNDLGSDNLYKEYGHTVNKNENFYETKPSKIRSNTLDKM